MGTNYYWHEKKPCECYDRPFEAKHIGKSSRGWVFALHVDPENVINDLPDWMLLWANGEIRNEYGDTLTPEEMLLVITARSGKCDWADRTWGDFYHDEADFHRKNYSVRGPNNLLRSTYNATPGSGTWDCVTGEFS
jgi:hypothetical protein